MNYRIIYLLVMIFYFASCTSENSEIAIFISPDGKASNNGSSVEQPFTTLEQARDAIRDLRKNGGLKKSVTVYLRGGLYMRSEPFVLTSEDSGTEEFPVTYRSYGEEKPVISGGIQVKNWASTQLNGNSVLVADLSNLAYKHFEQLWVNSHRAIQARTPNKGYLRVPNNQGADTKEVRREKSYDFKYKAEDESHLEGSEDGGVAVVFNKWLEYHMPIDRIDRENKKIISSKMGGRAIENDDAYYLEGGRTMLDQPGEWFLDREEDKLYYYPMAGETDVVATIPSLISVLRMDGDARSNEYIEHIQFKGLTFSHTTWILPRDVPESGYGQADIRMDGAVRLTGVRSSLFEECEIKAVGNYGLEISLGCSDIKILRCEIHDLGAGGILIGPKIRPRGKLGPEEIDKVELPEVLEDPADATGSIEIADSRIYDGGKYFHCAVGIWIGQSPDNHIHHNEIKNFYYTGISTGWTWGYGPSLARNNIYEYNHIHHIGGLENGDGWVLSDLGGIYSLGNHTGSVLRYNEFHDIGAGKYGGWAIYTDEGTRNFLIENNLAYRCKHAAFNQHYGKDNIIRNNIFAFAKTSVVMLAKRQPHIDYTLTNNILLSDGTPIYAGGYEYNVDEENAFKADSNLIWSTTGDILGAQNRFPSRLYEPDEPVMSWEEWLSQGNDQHTLIADPGFKDPENGDFTLGENSPALKIGFKPFPLGVAGPR